jgi:superfamily I DNA/RNA helicase
MHRAGRQRKFRAEHKRLGYAQLATMVSAFMERQPMIAAALARRYPIVVCDEHQDCSGDQHAIGLAMLEQGARLRIFADPMQRIYRVCLS